VSEWIDEGNRKTMLAVTLNAGGIWRADKPLVLRRLALR
jgi:hypothetical protein